MAQNKIMLELKAALSEAIACCFFVFFGAGSVSGALSATGDKGPVEPINYAASFGFGITILAFSIGDVSGAHINPAVTLSLLISRNLSPTRAVFYLIAQCVGGIVGGGILYAAVGGRPNYASGIGLAPDVTPVGGLVLEFMGTLLLIFVVFNVAVWSARPLENDMAGSTVSAMAPLPIGLAVFVSHLTLGPFTGCGINPARVIGAVVWESPAWWAGHTGRAFWIYWIGPFLASVVGPCLYYLLYGTFQPGTAGKKEESVATQTKVKPVEDGSTPVEPIK